MRIEFTNTDDLLKILGWFSTEKEVIKWAGYSMPFPLSMTTIKKDLDLENSVAYSFFDNAGCLVGFAQLFDRFGYKHLSRVTISPSFRGRGLGYELVLTLIEFTKHHDLDYSLFVFKDNLPAKKLYEKAGFVVYDYPKEREFIKGCQFMVKHSKKCEL